MTFSRPAQRRLERGRSLPEKPTRARFGQGRIAIWCPLVPAKAGTQGQRIETRSKPSLDSRLRGNERVRVGDQLHCYENLYLILSNIYRENFSDRFDGKVIRKCLDKCVAL